MNEKREWEDEDEEEEGEQAKTLSSSLSPSLPTHHASCFAKDSFLRFFFVSLLDEEPPEVQERMDGRTDG